MSLRQELLRTTACWDYRFMDVVVSNREQQMVPPGSSVTLTAPGSTIEGIVRSSYRDKEGWVVTFEDGRSVRMGGLAT